MKKFLEEILLNLKGKVHNYGFWVSLISAIIMLLQTLGVKIAEPNDIVGGICSIFVVLGIISNPNSGKGYIDKEVLTSAKNKKEETVKNTNQTENKNSSEIEKTITTTVSTESTVKTDVLVDNNTKSNSENTVEAEFLEENKK